MPQPTPILADRVAVVPTVQPTVVVQGVLAD